MSSLLALTLSLLTGAHDAGALSAAQFDKLVKGACGPYHDIAMIVEGNRSYTGPPGLYWGDHIKTVIYQCNYEYRNDNSIYQDLYERREDGERMLRRRTAVLFRGNIERLARIPDAGDVRRGRSRGAAIGFYDAGSPTRLIYLWYFADLKLAEHQYWFDGWEEIEGNMCAKVEISLRPVRPGSPALGPEPEGTRFKMWIDLARGGHVLKQELWVPGGLRSRVYDVRLEKVAAEGGELLWVPVKGVYEAYFDGKEFHDKPLFTETYSVVRGSVKINQKLGDDHFSVDRNWDSPAASPEMKAFRKSTANLKPEPRQRIDTASVTRRLDRSLDEADRQYERLLADSPARSSLVFARWMQATAALLGACAFGAAVWLRRRS